MTTETLIIKCNPVALEESMLDHPKKSTNLAVNQKWVSQTKIAPKSPSSVISCSPTGEAEEVITKCRKKV